MRKILVVVFIFFMLILTSTIGYKVVSANEKVDEAKDAILKQASKEEYFSPFGYTIENPNIIIDPYGISPLTALILFETDKEEKISIEVKGKSEEVDIKNTFEASKKHYIPVFGLYPNYSNKIVISYGNVKKEYTIDTSPLPVDFKVDSIDNINNITFVNKGKYPYAIDKNNDVRWYLKDSYLGGINRLSNNHFLLGSNSLFSNELVEIDLFGKIYHQYSIEDEYFGNFVEVDSNLFVLSNDLLKIDKQSGEVSKLFSLEEKYDAIYYDKDLNMLKLKGKKDIVVKLDDNSVATSNDVMFLDNRVVSSYLYSDREEYKIVKGVKFFNLEKTEESSKKIFLVGYKKIDNNYLKYNIKIKKNSDYLRISGNFSSNDEVYIILDKFMDKRIYDFVDEALVINRTGLNGKYSIYIQINGVLYMTDYYVIF